MKIEKHVKGIFHTAVEGFPLRFIHLFSIIINIIKVSIRVRKKGD
jgi:hypothetical protein